MCETYVRMDRFTDFFAIKFGGIHSSMNIQRQQYIEVEHDAKKVLGNEAPENTRNGNLT